MLSYRINSNNMWIFWALIAAVSAASVIVLTKAGLKNVDSNMAFAIQAIFIIVITWSIIAFKGSFAEIKEIDTKTWIFLISAGIATTLSTLFSYKALSLGPASYVSSVERLSLVFAILLSIIFLKEKITWQLVTGGLMMIGGAIIIALSDKSA